MTQHDLPDDDQERDIADDPYLSAIDSELGAINKRSDKKLMIALAIFLVVILSVKPLGIKPAGFVAAISITSAVLMLASIVYTIVSVVRKKRAVASKYGLICPACGHRPNVSMILSVATTLYCQKCRNPLPGQQRD